MRFNDHSRIAGQHAFLSASKYSWINYDDEKLYIAYQRAMAARRGTALHEYAHQAIKLGIKQSRSPKTLNMYINDAIGFHMASEQVLFYSRNAFGTADTISFRKNLLRIHDLKTGETPVSIKQLYIYAAFFCLEYDVKPPTIDIELRIYQNDEVVIDVPDPHDIIEIMNTIVRFDQRIELLLEEELS